MRIAVTGASGFIGRHLLAHLGEAGDPVLPIGRPDGRIPPGGVGVDPHDTAALARALAGAGAVVHLAGKAHVLSAPSGADAEFDRVNVQHAICVATAAAEVGATFVLVSSAGVLGRRSPPAGFNDEAPAAPYDAYTRSKAAAEVAVRQVAARTGLRLVIVRPPMVIGPGAPGNFGRLLGWAGRVPLPLAAFGARRSVVGARNLADFLRRCAIDPRAAGATMLVAEPEPWTVADMIRVVAHARHRPPLLFDLPPGLVAALLRAAGREADVARLFDDFVLHPVRAHRVLDWRPPHASADEFAWACAPASAR